MTMDAPGAWWESTRHRGKARASHVSRRRSANAALHVDLAEVGFGADAQLVRRAIPVVRVPRVVALLEPRVLEAGGDALHLQAHTDIGGDAQYQLPDGETRGDAHVLRPRATELEVHDADSATQANLFGVRIGEMHGEEVGGADVDLHVAHARAIRRREHQRRIRGAALQAKRSQRES